MLRRVIALLVAFAVLADRVADRALPVRFFVLWILRRAETAAAGFVFEETGMSPPALESTTAVGNGPDDALRLAARFRVLAAALCALLPAGCRFGRRPARRGFTSGHATQDFASGQGGWSPRPYDTS